MLDLFWPLEEPVSFLKFGAPDFENGHRLVAKHDTANVYLPAKWLKQLREDIARTAGTLIVNARDGIPLIIFFAHFDACPNDPVRTILHLCVAALNGIEIERLGILALHHT